MRNQSTLVSAAKAAGLRLDKTMRVPEGLMVVSDTTEDQAQPVLWNPFADDGDAFRLAVKLGLEIRNFNGAIHASKQGLVWREVAYFENGDLCATARYAIVRAAAAIGKRMVDKKRIEKQESNNG
jgi:hypothetical protein